MVRHVKITQIGADHMSTQGYGYGNQNAYEASVSFGDTDRSASARNSIDVTTECFMRDVIEESRKRTVLVDFWAPWCGPCKQLGPIIEKVVANTKGKVRLAKMNIDEHPAIAGQMGIQSIPAVIAFKDGQPVDGFMGALPESQIEQFLAKIGSANPDDAATGAALEEAKAAVASGNHPLAVQLYKDILVRDHHNVEAVTGMAGLYAEHDQIENAISLLDGLPEEAQGNSAVAALRTQIALLEEASKLGNPSEFEQKLVNDPDDLDARFQLALIRNAQSRCDEAVEHLLHIVRKDREFREDGARHQLLQLFEAWGNTDPATVKGRRKLSTALFS